MSMDAKCLRCGWDHLPSDHPLRGEIEAINSEKIIATIEGIEAEPTRLCPQCWGFGRIVTQNGPYMHRECSECGGKGVVSKPRHSANDQCEKSPAN